MATKNLPRELAVDCIYTSLIQLMEKKEYKDITITDITRRAGVSRMAYYRNFKDKDDIILNRIVSNFEEVERDIFRSERPFADRLWKKYFDKIKSDPVIFYGIKAGLAHQIYTMHKEFAMKIYEKYFHWDLSKEENLVDIYQRMGEMTGLLMYLSDYRQSASEDMISDRIIKMLSDDLLGYHYTSGKN